MFLRKFFQYVLCFFLLCILVATLSYKAACLISAYPNDWFLDEKLYQKDSTCHCEKKWSHRFICNTEFLEDFSPYSNDFEPLAKNSISILRNLKTRTVFLISVRDKKYVLKRYNVCGLFNFFQRAPLRSSLAYRSWHYGRELLKLGVATPQPVALFEKRMGPIWTTNYVITEYIQGTRLLDELEYSPPSDKTLKVLKKVKSDLLTLKQSRMIHSDYGFRNLLIDDDVPYLIDLDDLHRYQSVNSFFLKRFNRKHFDQIDGELKSFSTLSPSVASL